jgi:hypothetical protein
MVVWAGVLYSARDIPSAGDGSDKCQGVMMNAGMKTNGVVKHLTSAKATTRVRLFWQPYLQYFLLFFSVKLFKWME